MISSIARKIFGSRNQRVITRYSKLVQQINESGSTYDAMSDQQLKDCTQTFRQRLADGETVDALLPEVFAYVREASKRVLGMTHFDVQLIGGMVLHDGNIAEMRTGEGKTLMATLPVCLNALTGRGVHVVTVNDYLARRDAEWMGQLYQFLGLSVGVVVNGLSSDERRQAYAADITYGTNNEFGFDYLRDNMAFSLDQKVQRELHFAVVDEVDSILIDEARTPLIISGPTDDSSELYNKVDKLIPNLTKQDDEESAGDYTVDEKSKQIFLSEEGHQHIEELLADAGLLQAGESLYDVTNISLLHHVNAALRAHALFQLNVDYIIRDGQIVIVDEFTGRTMAGRRWSDGLHQAIEAKEGVAIQNENQTVASITYQNYFRLYETLSGMTGTADTEAFEFQQIYGLEVVVIPTHRPMIREDLGDLVYLTLEEKYQAIIEDIQECVARGQPVLVGTASIEASELVSNLLKKARVEHKVLNAKQHEFESQIIAQAGKPGSVTIATNMAGRGTDIVLGGNLDAELAGLDEQQRVEIEPQVREQWKLRHQQVLDAGGLHIIGTERHESRRIDNQLRGRAGRQGDPGSTRFYLSLEDNLMRIFASDKVRGLMQKLGMQKGESIEHPWVTKSIENAQRKVEAHNFDIRKNLLEYDDVANDQRRVIYQQRSELMEADDVSENIDSIREDVVDAIVETYVPLGSMDEQWDITGLQEAIQNEFGLELHIQQWLDNDPSLHDESLRDRIHAEVKQLLEKKESEYGVETMRRHEKEVMLRVLDSKWKEHLAAMDYLRQSIGLRGYAQKNPKQEYKREAFEMFEQMLNEIKQETISVIARSRIVTDEELQALARQFEAAQKQLQAQHAEAEDALHPQASAEPAAIAEEGPASQKAAPIKREQRKIGRNEPCYCGSGKKFKHCHGKL